MRTRSQKKSGRNRAPGDREPSGRLQRPEHRRDEVKSTVKQARERVYGLPSNFTDNPQSGYSLGVLYYYRVIDKQQHDAGLMIAEIIHDYFRIVFNMGPPIARAIDIARVAGRGSDTDRIHPKLDAAKDCYARMQDAVRKVDSQGKPVSQMLSRICMEDERMQAVNDHMLDQLRIGLNAIYDEFQDAIDAKFSQQSLIRQKDMEKLPEVA